ncbi:type II inositol 3,4-bisphosphate 4-phosphatase isoform X3 [Hippoglossus hippoglossus]|uniref:type II inositol 3,4-bisphosphate 4-phosphatase isoform X3 n=1 Tax=Hippoglossus hippoglossus TaxID=8267 RepID=UPI00148E27F9|nr:type II inositol 3,4-bisphosphate 4-phosphatase isoform X3 [Hippoglossus hippoglossus]XP_034447835.1 type II inositol 3,4-bisphosphate 4-phosphatase isoform X3 [Hippoglossus hippoglossus]
MVAKWGAAFEMSGLGLCFTCVETQGRIWKCLQNRGVILTPKLPQVELSLACNDLVASGRDRKPNALVQVAVIDPHQQHLVTQACTEIVEANKDPLFLTGVTFPSEYPASPETLVKLTVYDSKDKSQESSNFLGSATFSVGDLLRAKDERLTLSLRSSDGVCAAGTVVVSRLKMGEMEEVDVDHITTDIPPQKCPLVCDSASHACVDRENYPLTGPVFKNPVCKVYRFQTMDSKWMLVREQMEECTLSFSIPRQLLSLYIQQDMNRVQDLRELGELSPHWDNLRKEVMARYGGIIGYYQETLAELDKITGRSFKPSCCKAQKSLEFIPINLHTQRMRVTCPRKTGILSRLRQGASSSPRLKDAFYDIVTVGAPAAHFQGFKCGGLQRLLSRYEAEKKSFSTAYQCIYYSPEHTAKAQEVLSTVSLLQPLITSSADQLLQAAQERSSTGLKDVLKKLSDKTEQFVHTLKDELVKSALLALHAAQPGYVSKNQKPTPAQAGQHQGHVHQCSEQNPSPVQGLPGHSPATSVTESTVMCNNVDGSQTTTKGEGGTLPLKHQDSIPHHKEYDEEEWDRVWANVAKCLNCVIAMVDKLQEEDNNRQEPVPEQQLADVITSHNPGDWKEQLCPLVTRLKDCVMEVVGKAKRAMTFVLLQEAACSIPQGFLLQQRRDVVFSQALAALACGFVMRLYAGMEDKGFLRQLQLVGLVAQFESLLSTYSEEIGMLEDMEVGISDLQRVVFKITEAKTDDLSDLQPLVCGRRDHFTVEVPLPRLVFQTLPEEIKEGKPLQVFPVLFNVGINEQQTIAERFGDISLQERINQKNFEMLEAYYKSLSEKVPLECLPCFQTQTDVKELLETLGQNVVTKKRKNVEILWIAGSICRRLNGIRFTSCKSAKDRTSMSVTLEQCALLRDEHQLSKDCFIRALDCMRREGCRIENVQKNIRCRKYAFNMLQLMAFPKCYRPPEGTYGKVDS